MKIVLDTNVIVSALLNPNGLPSKILNLVITEKNRILYDNRIILEYQDVLKRKKFGFNAEWIDSLIDFIKVEGEFVISEPINLKFIDEDDKKFYEVAKSGNAKYLVTGNKKHFPDDDMIVTPKEYIESYY